MPRASILVPLLGVLTLLLAVPAAAGAQPATPTAPTPPTQPATGPGGMDYAYDRVVFTEHGEDAGGFLLFEPADPRGGGTPAASAPLPIVLFLSACCETDDLNDVTDNGAPWQDWIEHLTRRGAVVVFPRFAPDDPMPGVATAVRSALAELQGSGHPPTDPTRLAAVGHSFGAVLAVQYAQIAASEGLPVPIALMPTTPACGFCPPLGDAAAVPATTRLLVVVAEEDGHELGREFWDGLAQIPADRKDWVEVRTDRHGAPPLVADHGMPATDVFGALDSLDWYGTWKLFDALMACSFDGTWCSSALGDTPEQRFMGVWSDGVPVTELDVTDDPGAEPEVLAPTAATPAHHGGADGAADASAPLELWPAPDDPLERARLAGLEPERREHLDYHVHAHLDLFLDGRPVVVPAGIGINVDDPGVRRFDDPGGTGYGGIDLCDEPCISALHTHGTTGILHTESPRAEPNTLGQFFVEWGVRLDASCVGEFCRPETPIAIYVDGEPSAGNPADIVLTDLKQIAIVIGTPPAEIPATADFSQA